MKGNLRAQVLAPDRRQRHGVHCDFHLESRDAIKKFAGDDIEKTHFLPKDPQYLRALEPKVKHFDVLLDYRK